MCVCGGQRDSKANKGHEAAASQQVLEWACAGGWRLQPQPAPPCWQDNNSSLLSVVLEYS